MKQSYYFIRVRVKAGEVRAFVQIALMTSPRQIFEFITSPVLLGNDVLDMERVEGIVLLT
jgi:hypothetical protein